MRKFFSGLCAYILCIVILPSLFLAELGHGGDKAMLRGEIALILSCVVATAGAVVATIVFAFLHDHGLTRARDFALGGIAVSLFGNILLGVRAGELPELGVFLAASAVSLMGAMTYWVLAVRGAGPNNSSKPTPLRGAA